MSPRLRQLVGIHLVALAIVLSACGSSGVRPLAGTPPRAAVTTTPPRTTTATTRTAGTTLFAPTSVWNAPLSQSARLDPSSPRLVAALVGEVAQEEASRAGPWIETKSYSTPIYDVPADQPRVRVAIESSQPWARTLRTALSAVPLPSGAHPAAGTDGHLTVWQPSTDRLWELWQAHHEADGWHASWGGAMQNVSRSPGYFTSDSWPGARSYWGATATSLPVAAGTMRIAEFQHGEIRHALALDLPTIRANAYAWPAQRTDGTDGDPGSIPAGAHLRIDPNLDVRALELPQLTEMMALAAQRYGMIVRDQTHHAIGFYAEDPTPTGANPYPGLMEYRFPNELLIDFPWTHVQLLRMSLRHGTGRPRAQ